MVQCQANSKQSGEQCKRSAVPGRAVCSMHGGKTPVGMASPHFKHGRHSKYLPISLAKKYHEAQDDPVLLGLREEILLIDVRINQLLDQDEPNWSEITPQIEQRRKLVESEQKRLVQTGQMMTSEQIMTFLRNVVEILKRHISNRETMIAIAEDLKKFEEHNSGNVL